MGCFLGRRGFLLDAGLSVVGEFSAGDVPVIIRPSSHSAPTTTFTASFLRDKKGTPLRNKTNSQNST